MTNDIFCIYQIDYNNAVLGDKMYHLSNSTFFHVTQNLFMYKNVDLVDIYVTFLHTGITSFDRDVIFLQRRVANLHTCRIITLQVSHYYIQMSHFYITKSHPYRQIRDSYIFYMSHSDIHNVVFLHRYIAFFNREMSHSYIVD